MESHNKFKLILILCLASFGMQAKSDMVFAPIDTLPSVFMIGENEIEYEELVTKCNSPLLTVCNDSMDDAYRKWMGLLSDMEKFAESKDFDIRGIKIWLNVFWNKDGTIKHLVYYPKPNSRNLDFNDLSVFMNTFVSEYKMDFSYQKCFSHYGGATFPTFADIYLGDQK